MKYQYGLIIFSMFLVALVVSVVIYYYTKHQDINRSCFEQTFEIENTKLIIYKINMAQERTSNHVISDSTHSFYEKLDDGAKGFCQYIDNYNCQIPSVYRRIH